MPGTLNKAIVIGNLGKDAVLRQTGSGKGVTSFSLATEYSKKQQDGSYASEMTWHNIVMWGSEGVVPYLKKGTKVCVEGRIQNLSLIHI